MENVQSVRRRRMEEEQAQKEAGLEKQIRYCRTAIMKNEDRPEMVEKIQTQLKRHKADLFKLRGQWQDEFTHSKKKVKDSGGKHWYIIEAKYGSETRQEAICKTDGKWWSAGCRLESTNHREVEQAILQGFKSYWGI